MHSTSVRIVAFLGVCLMLGAVVIFRNQIGSLVNPGDRFAEAAMLMQKLQSSALYAGTLTDAQLDLLKTERENSQTRIATLTATISDDVARARVKIPTPEQQLAILDNFTLKTPRSLFNTGIDAKLGNLGNDASLKTLLNSINIQVNDKNIRTVYIAWYDEFFATVCTTNDAANDVTVRGTVSFLKPNTPSIVDTCENNTLVQTQCINRQKGNTLRTACANGCNNGICLNVPPTTLKGFIVTLPSSIVAGTFVDMTIEAVKNDNSRDTSYNKDVLILIDGDDNAVLPLTNQRLTSGLKQITQAIKFSQSGTFTLTIKDVESGTETSKTVTVSAGSSNNTACAGMRPANTTILADINTASSATQTWTYSNSGPSASCTFTCANGYTYNSSNNSCVATVTYRCIGTIPEHTIELANVGTADKAWEYNAGTGAAGSYPKCSFKCANGYHHVSGSCVADTPSTPECTGTRPPHTAILANVGASTLAWTYSESGTNPCTYSCETGYTYQSGACIAIPTCTGNRPANTDILSGVGAVSRPWTYAASGPSTNCTYTCSTGYTYNNAGECVATVIPSCTGNKPDHAVQLRGIDNSSTSQVWTYNAGTTTPYPYCTYKCDTGYHVDGPSCVADTAPPAPTCTGSRPANTDILSGVGAVDKAWEYNAGTGAVGSYPKCSFKCSNGYTRQGETCVAAPVCPPYTAMPANQCTGGTIVNNGTDANGCHLADTCTARTVTGVTQLPAYGKNCWFSTDTKIPLSTFLSYHTSTFANYDTITMFGDSIPTASTQSNEGLGYEDGQWIADSNELPFATTSLLSKYFYFTVYDEATSTRSWNIPTSGIKFYGCYEVGEVPLIW